MVQSPEEVPFEDHRLLSETWRRIASEKHRTMEDRLVLLSEGGQP
jgi:hypothetical protein